MLALPTLFVTLRLGWLLLHQYIGTGVDNYSGLQVRIRKRCHRRDKDHTNERGNSGPLVAAYRVTGVKRCPWRPPGCEPSIGVKKGVCRENPACEGSPFAVDVQPHTFSGFPWATRTYPATVGWGADAQTSENPYRRSQ